MTFAPSNDNHHHPMRPTHPYDRLLLALLQVFAFLLGLVCPMASAAQDSTFMVNERLVLDLPLIDAPYSLFAAEMAYNKRNGLAADGSAAPGLGDWLNGYESPSMQQALAVTKDLHSTNYYFTNKLWNRWLKPTSRKRLFLNRLAANAQAGVVDYALAYYGMVFGPVWLHEEFHRNGLTLRGISSFDDTYYRFGGGVPGGSVTEVFDADMARFKAEAPHELVRTFAAGIEGQIALVRGLQRDNFNLDTDHPNAVMNILITKQSVDYLRLFLQPDYDLHADTVGEFNDEEHERDFVGWDFTAWVYDMHRPDEPYTERGTHASGTGIDREIKRSDLTQEEEDYLKRMGDLHYINFLSPSMLSVHRIRIGERTGFNFAARHILTSFGYDLGGDLFLDHNGRKWMFGVHTYHNRANTFGGIELERYGMKTGRGKKAVQLDVRGMIWVQPENEAFYSTEGRPGGLLQVRARFPLGNVFSTYAEVEGKSRGWVMANPYLNENLTCRVGLSLNFGCSSL